MLYVFLYKTLFQLNFDELKLNALHKILLSVHFIQRSPFCFIFRMYETAVWAQAVGLSYHCIP